MSASKWISAVALFISTASATFKLPTSGTSWDVNSVHEIQWDTTGMKGPLQLHLAPGDRSYNDKYSDYSSYIGTLAPSIPNNGKWSWNPTMSIPKHHSSYVIIIIDSGGYYKYSPPFSMIGWPQKPGCTPPYVYSRPPYEYVETSTAAPIRLEPSPIIVTSIHVSKVVITSQPPPMIKTMERPPLIETQIVAPIIMTKMQEPITKTVTQPFLFSTEYLAPIVKCVTETRAPIIHKVSQPPKIIIETRAPIIFTEIKAPIIKTMYQPPEIKTEIKAPILITSEFTKTVQLTSFVNVSPGQTYAPEYNPPQYSQPSEYYQPPKGDEYKAPEYSQAPEYSKQPQYTSDIKYPENPSYSTTRKPEYVPDAVAPSAEIIPSAAPIFPNTTAIEIPAFTTPLALLATNPGVVTSTGLGGLTPTFTPNAAGRSSVVSLGWMGGLIALVTFLI